MAEEISIKRLIQDKNPGLAKRIPPVGYWFLNRITHVNRLNSYIHKASSLSPYEALNLALQELNISYNLSGPGVKIIETGLLESKRITICANHPFGGADALVLLDMAARRFGHPLIPANDLVQVVSPLASFFVPINKHGSDVSDEFRRQSPQNLLYHQEAGNSRISNNQMEKPNNQVAQAGMNHNSIKPFRNENFTFDRRDQEISNKPRGNRQNYKRLNIVFGLDNPIIVFPAGRTGRPEGGTITGDRIIDFPWTKTCVKKSRENNRVILPVFIRGRNSNLFYTVAWLRKKLNISANLEMILLVDELMKKQKNTLELIVGEPIDTGRIDYNKSTAQWTHEVQRYVHSLEGELLKEPL